MMEKLMVDTGVTWVRDYKVSGFRFDIMTFHPLGSMTNFRDAVQAVDPTTYIYGEGWNFGEVANDARFTTSRQANLGGTGIGSFSDRIRDPIKGGGCCDGGDALVKNQGFVNGLFYDPNAMNTGSTAERQSLITSSDNIRVWLAGGLKDYQLQNAAGATVTGAGIDYGNQPSGYTLDPQEAINYVEKHDNQTLWDFGAYRHPDSTSLADRVRAHNVGLSIILLGQGVPFLHAGSDILRSKSGDRDSYDSGDWFNELDWTLSGTKWAQGLPIADKNEPMWPTLEAKYQVVPRPDTAAQQRAFDNFREMLQIRRSSGLFRLRDAAQIKQRVKFYNTGPTQIPGLIAMGIDGCTNPNEPVPDRGALMVLFNASDTAQTLPLLGSETWTLHPVLAASTDTVVRTASHDANGFHVPARTTAVFQRAEQRSCAPYPVDMFVRGSFNDWGNTAATLPSYRLQFLGTTQYSVSGAPVTLPGSGLPQFKIADANWVAATNCGGVADGQVVLLGQPSTLRCGDGTPNLSLNVSTAGNYTFSLDAASTVNPVLTVTRTSPSNDQTVFIRGLFGDWGTTRPMAWDGERYYAGTINAAASGATGFKIATGDWATLNCGGAPGANDSVTIGQPYTLACGDGTTNLSVNFPAAGDYVFAVDGSNAGALRLTVEPSPVEVFVRGINGDWSDGAQNRMSYLGFGTYRIDRAVAAGATAFKIASSDWSTVNCGHPTSGQEVALGTPFTMTCPANENLNLTAPAAGTYRFKYTRSDNGLLITGP
jgi:pullulanase